MALSGYASRTLYTQIDEFNDKYATIRLELRIFGDDVIFYVNGKEKFKKYIMGSTGSSDFTKLIKIYLDGVEDGLTLKSLKNTLEEL